MFCFTTNKCQDMFIIVAKFCYADMIDRDIAMASVIYALISWGR